MENDFMSLGELFLFHTGYFAETYVCHLHLLAPLILILYVLSQIV
jgi:hypothetical protein